MQVAHVSLPRIVHVIKKKKKKKVNRRKNEQAQTGYVIAKTKAVKTQQQEGGTHSKPMQVSQHHRNSAERTR